MLENPGLMIFSNICRHFEIFEDSTSVYNAGTLRFELADNSILSGEVSIQDRPTLQAWEDTLEGFAAFINNNLPAKELW